MVATYVVLCSRRSRCGSRPGCSIAWNVGALGLSRPDCADDAAAPTANPRVEARPEDENQWVLLLLGIVAACAAHGGDRLGARPGQEHGRASPRPGISRWSARRILSAWTFIQVMFAMHYAGVYFAAVADGEPRRSRVSRQARAGLDGVRLSGFRRRLHLRQLRRQRHLEPDAAHLRRSRASSAFFFNTIILALAINIAAGFF